MTIHREGYKILLSVTIFFGLLNFGIMYFLPDMVLLQNVILIGSIIIFFFFLQFFRNPFVTISVNSGQVLAPADGKVVVIEETVETEYFKDKRKQVSIFMSPVNVHVNRNPVSGIVKYFRYHKGEYLVAWHPKSSTENERTTVVIQSESGPDILMRQIAGALARRIRWYIGEGQRVTQGAEFGFIKFGSRVDLFLPLDAKVKVSIGEKTKAGRTVIAELGKSWDKE